MIIGIFDIRPDGIYRLAPPERAWKWDKIFPLPKKNKTMAQRLSYAFKSYFDDSLGQMIWNRDQIKEIEKNGNILLTPDEAKQMAKYYRDKKTQAIKDETKRQMKKSLVRLMRGERNIDVRDNDKYVPDHLIR